MNGIGNGKIRKININKLTQREEGDDSIDTLALFKIIKEEEERITKEYTGCSDILKGIPYYNPQLEFNFGEINEQK